MNKTSLLPFLPLILFACSQAKTEEKATSALENDKNSAKITEFKPNLINDLTVPIEKVSIPSGTAQHITLTSGSTLDVPANAFVDCDGKPVQGSVTVEWQEFQTLPEIMLSGLPMTYDSCGVTHNFVSGGMFTINATQNGKALELAPEKSIDLSLASINSQPTFNFYKLNDKTGIWSYQSTQTAVTTEPAASLEQTDPVAEQPKLPRQKKNTVMDVKVNVSEFKELQGQQIIGWEAVDDMPTLLKSRVRLANTITKLLPSENQGEYVLNLKFKKEEFFINVRPYTFDQAMSETKENEDKIKKKNVALLDFLDRASKGLVIREIKIDAMATYNFDCVKDMKQFNELAGEFKIKNESLEVMSLCKVYYYCPKENFILAMPNFGGKVVVHKKSPQCLVAILPNNEIAIIKGSRLKEYVKSQQTGIQSMVFEKTGIVAKNSAHIGNVIKEYI